MQQILQVLQEEFVYLENTKYDGKFKKRNKKSIAFNNTFKNYLKRCFYCITYTYILSQKTYKQFLGRGETKISMNTECNEAASPEYSALLTHVKKFFKYF